MEITLKYYLLVSMLLFMVGLFGVILRRNIIIIFMCIELMLASASLSIVAFSRFNLQDGLPDYRGQIFVFFIIAIAAAEVAVGLALIVAIYRAKKAITVDELDVLVDK